VPYAWLVTMRLGFGGRATFFLCFILAAPVAMALEDCLPAFQKLRFNEDYSCFNNIGSYSGFFDSIKYMQLNKSSSIYLTIAGEARQRYAYTNNPSFGAGEQDENGVWLQRYVVSSDLRMGTYFRLFGQLYSAVESGQKGGPGPVDQNQLEIQNGFFEFNFTLVKPTRMLLRVGRQEQQFGSGRLVDVREGPNVRRTFDAVSLIFEGRNWRMDAIVARPRLVRSGVFDDKANGDQALWGVYASSGQNILPFGQVDMYYLGFRSNESTFEQGTAREVRHSLGTRLWGTAGRWDFNWEALYQFGTFGDKDISAWTVASETGYVWSDIRLRPRLALSANIASGDGDPSDDRLGTFNPLFPRGNYFSQAAVLGPRNFFNLHPYASVSPTATWKLTTDMNFFWRLQNEDGVYSPSGQLIRSSGGSDERFVGTAISLTSDWAISRNFTFTAIYSHFFPGIFIKETGAAANIDYFATTFRFRF